MQSIVYDQYPQVDALIEANTLEYLRIKFPEIPLLLLGDLSEEQMMDVAPLL